MSALIPADFGAVSTRFASTTVNDELSSGIQSSFGLVGYKGKVWSIRYRGDETPLMRDDGDGPRGSLEVVVIKASSQISKIWYENGYVEGSNAAPDCFSNNGVTPEPTALKKQCDSCALCPMNQWGSRITPAGKQGKACADSKRLAVVPLQDLDNDVYGGPMLLRVPAASLNDVAMYGQKMQQMGYPYFGIGTRIAFDPAESFPKFVFSAIRVLSDLEADKVLSLRDSHQVNRILSESEFGTPAETKPAADVASVFEQPPVTSAGNTIQATTQPVETDAERELRELKAQMAAKQQATQPVETDAERELRELKEQLAAKQAGEAAALKAAQDAEAAKAAEAKKKADAKAAKEAKALAEKEAAAKAELEALKAAANQPVETDAERELRELKAQLAAQGDLGNGASVATGVETPKVAETTPAPTQAETATASPSSGVAVPSDFEQGLDAMLNDLLT